MKQRVIYIATILVSVLYLFTANKIAVKNLPQYDNSNTKFVEAVITEITGIAPKASTENTEKPDIQFQAKITKGAQKGTVVSAVQSSDPMMVSPVKDVEKGDKILLTRTETADGEQWYFAEYIKILPVIFLGVLFLVALIIFGRKKGVSTVLSLIFTCLSVFAVFIPAVLSGKNIYFWSILTCIYIILLTVMLVTGPNRKGFAAGLGCLGGIAAAGLLTMIMDAVIGLTGFVDEDSIYLYLMNEGHPIDLKAITFGAIIIGAAGAIMDVSVDIAAALQEVFHKGRNLSFRTIFNSGITIGRDTVGTMTNTLVLAYIGSSLSTVLLLSAYNLKSLQYLFNSEMIIVEILQALVGSLGILLAIPLTSLICGFFFSRQHKEKAPAEEKDDDTKIEITE